MGYERFPGDPNRRRETQDYGRDYGSGRDYTYSSARDYAAAGYDRHERDERYGYGPREYGHGGYAQHDRQQYGGSRSRYDAPRQEFGGREWRGSHASDRGRYGDPRGYDQSHWRDDRSEHRSREGRGMPPGYDYEDRGFFARAGDELRSWFGDEEAERRREADMRYDEREYGGRWASDRDSDYGRWRAGQIAALDRDYEEYRQQHRSKFDNEFATWRSQRQSQRDALRKVDEHMEVVGSDGSHVGTVDKVRGDRIILAKNDSDSGGRHHSIPSSWLQSVDDRVTLSKTAEEAKRHWRDEERTSALFGTEWNDRNDRGDDDDHRGGRGMLNRSFSGTY